MCWGWVGGGGSAFSLTQAIHPQNGQVQADRKPTVLFSAASFVLDLLDFLRRFWVSASSFSSRATWSILSPRAVTRASTLPSRRRRCCCASHGIPGRN